MTILCWDGKTLAADRSAVSDGIRYQTTKIWRFKKELLGIIGQLSLGVAMVEWYQSGKVSPFPIGGSDSEGSLILIDKKGHVWEFEGSPVPFRIEGPFCSFGSGAEGGLVALDLGCTAVEAVIVVSKYNTGCGGGYDSLVL